MADQNIETYFEQNSVDGVLPDDAMAKFLTGNMGDTAAVAEAGDTPEPAPEKEVMPEQQPAAEQPEGDGKPDDATAKEEGEDPVILAKDGKNIIPYDKLVEARVAAKTAKDQNAALMQEMESIKEQIASMNAGKQTEHDEQPPEKVDVNQLEREWHEAILDDDMDKAVDIRAKINSELRKQAIDEARADLQAQREADAQHQKQVSAQQMLNQAAEDVLKDYPELDITSDAGDEAKVAEVVEYRDFLIHSRGVQPHEALRQAAQRIMGEATRRAGGDTPAPKVDATKVEPKVKERTPTTMSDIPAGTAVHTDEAEALTQMSNTALLAKMMSMDPAKIEQMTLRLV